MILMRSSSLIGLRLLYRKMPKYVVFAVLSVLFFVAVLLYYIHSDEDHFKNTTDNDFQDSKVQESNYAVIIDAGSSGSRIYMYKWPPHSGREHELLDIKPIVDDKGEPFVHKVQPGLSSFASKPDEIVQYLKPLLSFAEKHIPKDQHKTTPLYILATAGMRLLSAEEQSKILAIVRAKLPGTTNFHFPKKNIDIISGKQEGIFQWLAINYALGRLNHSNSNLISTKFGTVGIMDMGGASVQIAFEIQSRYQLKKPEVMSINIGCTDDSPVHTYKIYVNTFLGYGANEKLEHHRMQLILDDMSLSNSDSVSDIIKDPCYPPGKKVTFPLNDDFKSVIKEISKKEIKNDSVTFEGIGLWDSCVLLGKKLVEFNEPGVVCAPTECSTNIRSRPPVAYNSSLFYGFSEFWYSMEDVFSLGGKYNYNSYSNAAKNFCETGWVVHHQKFDTKQYPNADFERLETQCFKSSWLLSFLHYGMGFPDNYRNLVSSPNTVEGKVVHWTLGATLYKTRFYPLQAIQSVQNFSQQPSSSKFYLPHFISFTLIVCFLLVIIAIAVYIYRLRKLNSRLKYAKFDYISLSGKTIHRSQTCPSFE